MRPGARNKCRSRVRASSDVETVIGWIEIESAPTATPSEFNNFHSFQVAV